MGKYITKITLGEDANDFAQIVGVLGFCGNRYICQALDSDGNIMHSQTFSLPKNIDGLPANDSALKDDVLKSWNSEELKRRKAQEGINADIKKDNRFNCALRRLLIVYGMRE